MKTFNVLPTDPRFQDLTSEQRDFIWENYLIDNPEIEKKMRDRFDDPEFDQEWDALGESAEDSSEDVSEVSEGNSDHDEVESIEANYKTFLDGDSELQLPDYREILKAKGIVVDNDNLTIEEDWEEVDD